MKHLLFLFLFSFSLISFVKAQGYQINENEKSWYQSDTIHTALLPDFYSDSISNYLKTWRFSTLNISISPILNVEASYSEKALFDNKVGVEILAKLGEKLTFSSILPIGLVRYANYYAQPTLQNYSFDSLHRIYHFGKSYSMGTNTYLYFPITATLSYTPSKFFNFQIGNDRNFIGDGYRSLLLSDNSNSYWFFKTTVNVWHFKYMSMIARLQDVNYTLKEGISEENGGVVVSKNGANDLKTKYAAIHCLSWNATRWLNLYFYEAIIWNAHDSLGKRGIDMSYLNPVIFYRPVEMQNGSPDNALMGFGGKIRLSKNYFLYGQFLLDEFILKEFRANTNWWGNKYGFQAGIKTFDLFSINNLNLLLEANYVRPFTYSHENPLQLLGTYQESMTHPLGANFIESLGVLSYTINKLRIDAKLMYAIYGTDNDTTNVGHDIYKSYHTRKNFDNQKDYGQKMLQGIVHKQLFSELKFSYPFFKKVNVELGFQYRSLITPNETKNYTLFFLGIRTHLFTDKKEYIIN